MICFKEQELTASDILTQDCNSLLNKYESIINIETNSLAEKMSKILDVIRLKRSYKLLKDKIKNHLFQEYSYLRFIQNYYRLSLDYYFTQDPIKDKEPSLREAYYNLEVRLKQS